VSIYTLKKRLALFPARESLVSDIPAGDGKIVTIFYSASGQLFERDNKLFNYFNTVTSPLLFHRIFSFSFLFKSVLGLLLVSIPNPQREYQREVHIGYVVFVIPVLMGGNFIETLSYCGVYREQIPYL
jgi:hypothetical protein